MGSLRIKAITAAGVIAGVCCLFSLGCDEDAIRPGSGLVQGYAYLRGSTDHSGTVVRIAGAVETTVDSTGYYEFQDIPDGEWQVRASHPWYYDGAVMAKVERGRLTEPIEDMYLSPVNVGYVFLQGADDHLGICVYLDGWGPVWGTGSDGYYLLPPLEDGLHVVTYEFPGYPPLEREVSVVGGRAVPELGEVTVPGPDHPIIIQVIDVSHPSSNPSGTPAAIDVTAEFVGGGEAARERYTIDGNWGSNGCVGNYLVLGDLDAGVAYDIVLTAPRYFYLQFRDRPSNVSPDTLAIKSIAPVAGTAVRTEFIELLSYVPDEIVLVLSSEMTEEERLDLIRSMGCSVLRSVWSSTYNAPMYVIDIPDDRTELEMVRLFAAMEEVQFVHVGTVASPSLDSSIDYQALHSTDL